MMDKVYSRHTIYGPPEALPERLKKFRAMSDTEYQYYSAKVRESGGFDVDGCLGTLPGRIVPIIKGKGQWRDAECAAKFAADEGKSIRDIKLVKANLQPISGVLYYLTFTGIDVESNAERLYKAKVRVTPGDCDMELYYFEDFSDSHKSAPEMDMPRVPKRVLKAGEGFNPFKKREEIQRQNPNWEYSMVRKAASKKWKSFRICDKVPYLTEARRRWNEKVFEDWKMPWLTKEIYK